MKFVNELNPTSGIWKKHKWERKYKYRVEEQYKI